ncbi:hypothetical protein FIA58_006060 [Flavobacterium jejuense]|uniref:Protein NO VEIN C-terminal domain-containing protein n=1 Tax=Flavobacterium jejuense TaxID=1544455 RepID=A0ABX0ING1_9FLAO|nr:hypothetical protein [Flavobacterium jejuense]NHN25238.1 hypothetical protein [Flavobacterium jejuense]
MILDVITKNHIIKSASIIDKQGIPKNFVWSQYYVIVNNKEYQFKYLIRLAYQLATNEELDFQSNNTIRKYIEDLGFEIKYYQGGYNFFTKEELAFYNSIVNTDYRKANSEHKYYGQKLYPIIAKAKYWAEELLIDDFKLRKDGNWLNGHVAKIKPYFWPRIYSGEDKDIFFNVEVNGSNKFIGYKLDGYFETTKRLPDYKIKLLQEYKEIVNWSWPKISFDNIDEYNWDKLIEESKAYINKHLSNHNHLKRILSKESKICRITWNNNGWIKPSGLSGKSKHPSFEKENGFGHEEWLFDGNKIIDGYKYGFLEPIHKFRTKYQAKLFDLLLYTRDSDSNQNYWVTTLKDVEVINTEESEKVLVHYKNEGWYDEMKSDLYNLSLDSKQLDTWIDEGAQQLFNIKFKASQINEIPNDLILVENPNEIPSSRYLLMDFKNDVTEKIKENIKTKFSFYNSGSEEAELESKGKRKRNRKDIELEFKHNLLQKKFLQFLQNKYGKNAVKRECTAYGASRIDITRKTNTGFVFYEIKTYNSLRSSIREGLGQLLEYCLYPNVNEAESIVLVSHVEPSTELKEYLIHIKKFINLPFSYIHFDLDKEKIISEI